MFNKMNKWNCLCRNYDKDDDGDKHQETDMSFSEVGNKSSPPESESVAEDLITWPENIDQQVRDHSVKRFTKIHSRRFFSKLKWVTIFKSSPSKEACK